MKVQRLDTAENQIRGKNENRSNRVKFTAKPNWGKVNSEVAKHVPWPIRFFNYVGKNDGEILNNCVTFLGTAVVAPIFIAGNPFSKEDKDTKWYSAMRQPISAVIQFVAQVGINSVYNDWLDKMVSTGAFKEFYDLSAQPRAEYLKKIIKLEQPELSGPALKEEITKRQKLAERIVTAKKRKEMASKPIETKDLLCKNALDSAEKQLTDEYKKANNIKTERCNKKFTPEQIKERALKNIEYKLELEAHSKYKIREFKKNGLTVEQAIAECAKKQPKSEMGKAILKDLQKRLGEIQRYEEAIQCKPFESVKDLGKNFKEVLQSIKVKKLVQARTSDAAKAFGKMKSTTGIFVSLITLPFTCGLLNWVYPRVMEKIMPTISEWIHRNDPVETKPKIEAGKTEKDDDDDDNIEETAKSGGRDDD